MKLYAQNMEYYHHCDEIIKRWNYPNIKHLLDETESNIQFIESGQGNIRRSEAEPNIIL